MPRSRHVYAIALGSNQPRSRSLTPRRLVLNALERFTHKPFKALDQSRLVETVPLGPSRRRYVNAAILVRTSLDPDEMLDKLHKIERKAGRNRRCRAWSGRSLDLDIILWSGGMWSSDNLTIPHPAFRERTFVLQPLAAIARSWRDPLTNLNIAHLLARLKKPRHLHEAG